MKREKMEERRERGGMHVAVLGSGGREHALVWRLHKSESVDKIYAIPGNPGMASWAVCVTPQNIDSCEEIIELLKTYRIDLVIIGPEALLVNGIGDAIRQAGFAVFGPSMEAAQLEGSKRFAKEIMRKYGIPTAKYEVFTDSYKAKDYVEKMGAPIVIKADGLAGGKGVVVAQSVAEAKEAISYMLDEGTYGTDCLVIEECMVGEEASFLAFVDGNQAVPMIAAQDHKRLLDDDEGPNTGGMGTYAPAPVMTESLRQETIERILNPLVQAMKNEGIPFVGCLYIGLMITASGVKVVEFNVRFGDPETQVLLLLLKGDLGKICYACATGNLSDDLVEWSQESALCVIMASENYPYKTSSEQVIKGDLEPQENSIVFHSGTKLLARNVKRERLPSQYVACGGRVLGIVGIGKDLKAAREIAYNRLKTIDFDGAQYRRDIGKKGLI